MSVEYRYHEEYYPEQTLNENVHFQNYSSKDCFIDLASTFIYLHFNIKTLNKEKPSFVDGLSYEKCLLRNFFTNKCLRKLNLGDHKQQSFKPCKFIKFVVRLQNPSKKMTKLAFGY